MLEALRNSMLLLDTMKNTKNSLNRSSDNFRLDIVQMILMLVIVAAGYQSELTYQRVDGSFSAFGNRDQSGSMW